MLRGEDSRKLMALFVFFGSNYAHLFLLGDSFIEIVELIQAEFVS